MKLVAEAVFLGGTTGKSKNGNQFGILRFADKSDGSLLSAFTDDLSVQYSLKQFKPHTLIVEYTENGNFKSMSYVSAEEIKQ
ncbi:hypothetical protein [Peptococcus niger]|uniref:Uncharacterized protein n=1 Tax=Peptococcus niger TaxID=2741 RepID=A0A1G6S441_PEPNI|nr:hypothetical protein [Peptococcus niger]SDD11628.1 hypothetical protein SAMN04489866_101220 [Peptococcus niger]